MSQLLAIDWDRREARYVLASARGGKLTIAAARSIVIPELPEEDVTELPDVGELLKGALAEGKLGRVVTLVGVDRASIDLLHLTLPPAEDAELPEMVANQVVRESQVATDEAAVDFVPVSDRADEPRQVTAAVLPEEQLRRIETTCKVAGLKPHRLLLRSYAAASVFLRTVPAPDETCLLVNAIADEVDLTVLVRGKVAFLRTARLPAAAGEQATRRLLAEINRTLAVALQSEFGTDPVECVYIFGHGDEHQALLEQIHEQLMLPARVLDPFEAFDLSDVPVPEGPGRFAPLLGMLLDEARGGEHAIDFLHPRRPAKQVNRRRIGAIAGVVVVAGILAAGYLAWSSAKEAQAKIEYGLKVELAGLIKEVKQESRLVQAVSGWQSGDVLWLEELRELSLKLPADKDMMVLRLTMTSARSGSGGQISLQGLVRDQSLVVPLEEAVRSPYHGVSTPAVHRLATGQDYPWQFNASITVARRDKSRYTRHLPAGPQAAPENALVRQPPGGKSGRAPTEKPGQAAAVKVPQQADVLQ